MMPYASHAGNPDYGGTGSLGSVANGTIDGDDSGPFAKAFSSALATDNSGDNGLTIRQQMQLTAGGRQVRVSFKAGSLGLVVDHASVGIYSGSGGQGGTVGIPIELSFAGKPGFSLTNAQTIKSDWLNFPVSPFDTLVVVMDNNSTNGQEGKQSASEAATTIATYFTGASYNAVAGPGTPTAGPLASTCQSVLSVEVR
jgi:hypothetical protein